MAWRYAWMGLASGLHVLVCELGTEIFNARFV